MIEIHLTRGYVATVDDEDAHLSVFRWRAQVAPRTVYAKRHVRLSDGRWSTQYLHRAVLPGVPRVDHRDGNGLNCRRSNLRPADRRQNGANARIALSNSSGFKGVNWHRRGRKWQARIEAGGRQVYLGLFASPEEAARAYDDAARRLQGEYAAVNFPGENERAA